VDQVVVGADMLAHTAAEVLLLDKVMLAELVSGRVTGKLVAEGVADTLLRAMDQTATLAATVAQD
jgi:hypothetical protein